MMEPSVLLLDEPSAGLSPVRQDETFMRTRRINKTGVCVVMVEQNARRCLQICDRGYVLDQGRDAHTGTGRELANDPKVIELYLGTLGRGRRRLETVSPTRGERAQRARLREGGAGRGGGARNEGRPRPGSAGTKPPGVPAPAAVWSPDPAVVTTVRSGRPRPQAVCWP